MSRTKKKSAKRAKKPKKFVPTSLLAFGAPRVVFGIKAWEEEVDRQKLLAAVGLLRRFEDRTWGWSMAVTLNEDESEGEQVWHWESGGNYKPSKFTDVVDFESAWAEITDPRRVSSANEWES